MTTKKPFWAICALLLLSLISVPFWAKLEPSETLTHFGTKWLSDFWVIFLADLAAAFIAYSLWENHKQKQADEQENEIADKYLDKIGPVLEKYEIQYSMLFEGLTTMDRAAKMKFMQKVMSESPSVESFGFDLTRVRWGHQFYSGIRELGNGYNVVMAMFFSENNQEAATYINKMRSQVVDLRTHLIKTKAAITKKRRAGN